MKSWFQTSLFQLHVSNACYNKSEVMPTNIKFSEQIIINDISEISASSAPGLDVIHYRLITDQYLSLQT